MQRNTSYRLGLTGLVCTMFLGAWWAYSQTLVSEAEPLPQPAMPSAAQVSIYDADSRHLWNRLYSALLVRAAPDEQEFGLDEIDPLLWSNSKYLLTGPGHSRVVSLLDEFLATNAEELIREPLKRALFQRDVLSIFEWTADPRTEEHEETGHLIVERQALRRRLAGVIWRLSLSAAEIQALPDNYAAAVAAKVIPAAYDPDRPDAGYLPPNLFSPEGPWVMLEVRGGGMAAPAHMDLLSGRSTFFVFVSLPEGRKATLDYLEKLRTFPNPVMPRPADTSDRARNFGPLLNPALPQFPAGTQFALVRQMLLIDDQGRLTPTRLIESVEIRAFRGIPKEEIASGQHSKQDFYKIALCRKDLFAGNAGGFHVVSSEDADFNLLSGADEDVFEKPSNDLTQPRESFARKRATVRTENLKSCMSCHAQEPGIHSVLTYQSVPPPDLVESERRRQEQASLSWKKQHYGWALLRGLTEASR